ncbi:MAG: hypothetical protein R3C19_25235 [Planctomycetaceae bacterium]
MHCDDTPNDNPFIPLEWAMSHHTHSDEEYVGKLRKTLQWWDRWRWLGVAFYAAIFAAFVFAGSKLVSLARHTSSVFGDVSSTIELVAIPSAMLGVYLGFIFGKSSYAAMLLLCGMRTERLLLRYHDRQHAIEMKAGDRHPTEPCDQDQ